MRSIARSYHKPVARSVTTAWWALILLAFLPFAVFAQSGATVQVELLKGPTGMGGIQLIEESPSFDGVEVEYRLSGSPSNTVARVLSGEVDIAALPSNVAAKVYNAGAPYRLAAINTLGVLYLVSRDGGVNDWRDLRGQTIGNIGRGANPDMIFRHLLKENGLDPDADVSLRFYNHTELAQLLIAGRQDIGVLPEPFVTRVVNAAPDARVVLDLQAEWQDLKGSDAEIGMGALVVKASLIESDPAFVEQFLKHYRDSVEFVNSEPETAGVLIEKHGLGFTAASASSAIPRANIVFRPAPEARGAFEEYLEVLLSFDPASIGGSLPDDGFYMERALP